MGEGSKCPFEPYTPPSSPAPQNNRTENGLQCPACIVPFQETCPGTKAAHCVGQETHCIYFAGNVQAGEGHLDLWRRGQVPQNWKPMLPGSREDGGPRELGVEVAGAKRKERLGP